MKKKDEGPTQGLTRRQFIAGATATAATGAAALAACGDSSILAPVAGSVPPPASPSPVITPAPDPVPSTLPAPKDAGFDHVVVVMLENRSFDHYLGWVPGADGVQAGTKLMGRDGKMAESFNMAPQYQNCQLADPDHSYAGGRTQINEGRMDGFLLTQPVGDAFPIGYYTAATLPFFKGCADHWTICDRYFSGILGATTPNRFYMHAGQTDRAGNTTDISTLPTVWDRMLGVGKRVAYYYTDVSYTSYWGSQYAGFSKKFDLQSFKADMANGTLADLTFVDNVGNTFNEGGAVSMDDHPYADVRDGQAFLNHIYEALKKSPQWERTLVVINYDEWGGFYDHVTPPFAPVTAVERAATGNDGRLGCRVPCVLIGPRVKRGHVEHRQFDPNSILNMLAWRFGFEPLGARASSNNMALALDYANPPNPAAPTFNVPVGPFGGLCAPIALIADQSPVPLPVPMVPVDPIPLPVPVQLPPVPGVDVPVPLPSPPATPPSAAEIAAQEVMRRRIEHEAELQALRDLGSRFGF